MSFEVLSLPGLTPFRKAYEIQLDLLEKRIRDEIQDTFIFVEHTPVVTRGRGLQFTGEPRERAMPMMPLPSGIDYVEIERGGDLTYHGPGQLTVYPIVKLDGRGWGPNHDLGAYLRKLEHVLDPIFKQFNLEPIFKEGASGIWLKTAAGEKKIASLGVAVRRWVTFHGIAINLSTDLKYFQLISPCGFSPDVMANLSDFLPPNFSDKFESPRAWLESQIRGSLSQ